MKQKTKSTKCNAKFSKDKNTQILENKLNALGLSIEEVKSMIEEETLRTAVRNHSFDYVDFVQEDASFDTEERVLFAVAEETGNAEVWFNGAKIPNVTKAFLRYDAEMPTPTLVLEVEAPCIGIRPD